ATHNGHERLVDMTIKREADAKKSEITWPQFSPLSRAASRGYFSVISTIIRSGVSLCGDSEHMYIGAQALQAAAQFGSARAVLALVGYGAAVKNDAVSFSRNPTWYNAKRGHDHIIRLFVKAGLDVNHPRDISQHALCAAIRGGHESAVCILVALGVDIN
ncbi:ankyrin, partial [Patellaria atrata CBS 101060]